MIYLNKSYFQRAWYRTILMLGFNFLVQTLSGIHGIKDTQCGFKLFSRRAARCVFPTLHLERWAFDIEVLYIASRVGYQICVSNEQFINNKQEVPVKWVEIEGSKINVIQASISMFRDMVATRLAYVFHIWTLPTRVDEKSC